MPRLKAGLLTLVCFVFVLFAEHGLCFQLLPRKVARACQQHSLYAQPSSTSEKNFALEPRVEWARFVVNVNLRKQLKQLLQDEGCDSSRGWIRAFERWELYHLCRASLSTSVIAPNLYDPLVPSSADEANRASLISDLANLGDMNEEKAIRVTDKLYRSADHMIQRTQRLENMVKEKRKSKDTSSTSSSSSIDDSSYKKLKVEQLKALLKERGLPVSGIKGVLIDRLLDSDKNNNDISESDTENDTNSDWKESIRVTEDKGVVYMDLDKLEMTQNPPFKLNVDVYNGLLQQVDGDLSIIYCLMARYEGLEGKGFQAALPSPVFADVVDKMELTTECFASPLNNYLDNYCSAFPDVDGYFGSRGSFFDLEITSGSYQANPPFTQPIMQSFCDTVEKALRNPSMGPLSFTVIVPAWKKEPAWNRLDSSEFCTRSFDIEALEHSYQQADCYRRRSNEQLRLSQFASSIFFLQNEAGAQKWPVTDEVVDSIINSFSENLPPESEIEKMREKGLYIPKSQRNQMKDEVAADEFFNEWLKDI